MRVNRDYVNAVAVNAVNAGANPSFVDRVIEKYNESLRDKNAGRISLEQHAHDVELLRVQFEQFEKRRR